MTKLGRVGLTVVVCVLGGIAPGFVTAGTVPVTSNLLVNLNGDSTTNFVSNGTFVQVWKDQAENGTDASQQDFGQSVAGRQPVLVANANVPNSAALGLTYNLVDFDRSAAFNSSRSSGSGSDTLKGKNPATARSANYGDAYSAGADAAYQASNATGLSWFVVFRSSDIAAINDSQSAAWGRQAPLDITYANTATSGANWIGTYLFDKSDPDTQVNVSSHVRDTADSERHNDPSPVTASNLTTNTWYMMGNSYDPVLGTLRTLLTTPNGSGGTAVVFDSLLSDPTLINANGLGNGGAHLAAGLGTFATSNGGNGDWSFDGLMAEVLVYNAGLNPTAFDSVSSYLNDKYFNVPEPTIGCLICVCGALMLPTAGRRRAAH